MSEKRARIPCNAAAQTRRAPPRTPAHPYPTIAYPTAAMSACAPCLCRRHEEHKRRLETRALAEARRKAQSAWQKVDVQRYEAVQQESRQGHTELRTHTYNTYGTRQ